jgi:hypothetical protein
MELADLRWQRDALIKLVEQLHRTEKRGKEEYAEDRVETEHFLT